MLPDLINIYLNLIGAIGVILVSILALKNRNEIQTRHNKLNKRLDTLLKRIEDHEDKLDLTLEETNKIIKETK